MQTLLDQFFESLTGSLERAASKSALSQARQKLKASVFEALSLRLLTRFAEEHSEPRWRGLRLVAADSTTLRLPNRAENREAFGVQHDTSGNPYVMARALGLFATASKLMLKSVIAPYRDSERSLLVQQLSSLQTDDLLIVDRGFPAVWLFAHLIQSKRHFIARLDGVNWPEATALLRSNQNECIYTRNISPQARQQAAKQGVNLSASTLSFRLIRVILPNGKVQILATSLTDPVTFPAAEFKSLYKARWNIEEAFKTLKHRLHVEQFSGELPESIRQDFHAKVFTANLAAVFAFSSQELIPADKAERYRPNLSYILENLRNRLFRWLLVDCGANEILSLLALFAGTLELKRPGRTAARPAKHTKPKPRRSYK